jgi:cytochrome c oxidase subunit 2
MTLWLAIPLGRPFDASLDGFRNDTLFYVTTVMAGVLFVIMCGILVWACVMHRAGKSQARYELGLGRRQIAFTALVTAGIFLGVDGTLVVDSFLELDQALWKFPGAAAHPLEVEVYAQQWAWNVRYPGSDGKFGTADDIVTLNELHIPLDRPVIVKLKSKDVVHSFYLPNFRIKQDALPDVVTRLWFQAKRAGVFEIGCAQHCGANHYKMRGLLTVEDAAAFDTWLRAAQSDARQRWDDADADAHWGWPWES